MIPHPGPGQTPERHALDQAEVQTRVGMAVIAGQRAGLTRTEFNALVFQEWSTVEKIQTAAATEAGRHATRRRGPRGKGAR